jgi:uncharacterized membrane protein YgdD (TMEM256/DUF423 family)
VEGAAAADLGLIRMRPWLTAAALVGFLCVAFGAFAAHGASDPKAQEWLRTGALYGSVHALAVFAAASLRSRRARFAPPILLAGVALFSGSLWTMALGGPRWLGAVTPIGGLCFLAGWILLAWATRDPTET